MATKIRYLGVAAFEITNSDGVVVLVDPYIDENVSSPIKTSDLKRVDLILVTHAASDHLGDTAKLSKRFNAPIVCGADVKAHLMREGVQPDKISATIWGLLRKMRTIFGYNMIERCSRHLSRVVSAVGKI